MLSLDIKNISIWSKIQGFMKINQPDKAAVSCVCNLFNNNFLPHFQANLKESVETDHLASVFDQHKSSHSEASPVAKKTKKLKST